MLGRALTRDEVKDVWTIDRSEIIHHIYYRIDGELVLKPEYYDMDGWPEGEAGQYTPILEACYDRGGWFYGLFDGGKLIGVVVVDNRFLSHDQDQLQLKFLHVSSLYRGKGLGRQLFNLAVAEARRRGAQSLYISATPSESTVHFYQGLGCTITLQPDPALYALDPEDIHFIFQL
ncbi:GNAT family N-acetyltransferase [Aquirhabdus sp.]|uniref:GNAT family N-acetyltransferase n=1 Tax=Aquirhabdus sp. TaxID=2824160 RepID=UPI00396C508E